MRTPVLKILPLLALGLVTVLSACDKTEGNQTPDTPQLIQPETVDLGLSVLWADRNVGAASPSAPGNHYAFGETVPKQVYTRESYQCDNYYWDSDTYQLKAEDDAATLQLGEGWRTPTDDELIELKNNCMWERVVLDGQFGYKVTSKINGNSIFLPAAGYKKDQQLVNGNKRGYYWSCHSSSYYSGYRADYLHFFSLGNGRGVAIVSHVRWYGFSVRAVKDK